MDGRALGGGFGWLLFICGAVAACSAAGNIGSGGPDPGAAGKGGAGGAQAGGTGAPGPGGTSAGAGAAGASGKGTAGTAAAGATAAGGAAGDGGAGGGLATGGGGPTTNATCLPGVAPGAPQTVPILALAGDAPPDAASKFGGAVDPSLAPVLVYPNDQTLVPPNLTRLEIHFQPGGQTTLYEIRFANQAVDFRYYTPCPPLGGGCVAAIDGLNWTTLANSARGSGPIALTVRGVGATDVTHVGVSAARVLEVAPDAVQGGIYYWNAGGSEIVRYDFGSPAGVAEQYYTTGEAGTTCVGCHSLSRKGNRIAVGISAPIMEVPLRVLDVATKKPIFQIPGNGYSAGSSFQAFSPDETEILVSDGNSLTALDAVTGALKGPSPLVPVGTMADYVPDNSGLVYAKSAAPPCNGFLCNPFIVGGSIAYMPRQSGVWGAEQILVPSGGNNFYPSVSPDGKTVLFNHSAGGPEGSYEATDASLWAVSVAGSKPFSLARANASPENASNSWPKFAPFVGCAGEIMWFTFSSNRDYGLRIKNAKADPKNQTWQLWMAAFNHTKAMQGEDPSFSSFWLPFQDPATGNHIAQWVEKVGRKPCMKDEECNGVTVSGAKLVCTQGFCGPG